MQKVTGLVVIVHLLFADFSFSQKTDSTKMVSYLSGSVSVQMVCMDTNLANPP